MPNISFLKKTTTNKIKQLRALLLFTVVWICSIPGSHAQGPQLELKIGDTVLNIAADEPFTTLSDEELSRWITQSAEAVATYYGHFPGERVSIDLLVDHGGGVRGGKAYGQPRKRLTVTLGRDSEMEDLNRDWVLVHEMVHLAFPEVQQRHHWIEEGLSVYIESVARAQAGQLTPEFVWSGFLNSMHHGLPKSGDKGLDNTPTWGRTYWGGALFCLVADIEIRKQTDNRKSLRDAMSGILKAGLDIKDTRPIETVLEVADKAIGLTVLMDTYNQMKDTPYAPDLDQLWKELGVSRSNDKIVYDDTAPLAHVRKALFSAE